MSRPQRRLARRAAIAVFAGLFAPVLVIALVTAGPLRNQIVEFPHALPG